MTAKKTVTVNDQYHHRKALGVADFETPRGKVAEQTSPGKGIVAKLLIDYQDLSREKRLRGNAYAHVVTATFPMSMERVYDRIADAAVRKHGRTQKAEMMATMEMLAQGGGNILFVDKALLEDPKIKAAFQKIPNFEAAYEKITDAARADQVPDKTPEYEKVMASALEDVNFPQRPLSDDLKMHEEWKRYFEARTPSQAPGM